MFYQKGAEVPQKLSEKLNSDLNSAQSFSKMGTPECNNFSHNRPRSPRLLQKTRFAFRFKMYYLCIAEREALSMRVMPLLYCIEYQ